MNPNEIIGRCLAEAQAELNKITCYDTKLKLNLAYKSYQYVNGKFIEEAEGDRGEVYRKTVADSPEKFVEYLLYSAIKRFAFSYECRHRRPFEDNRRQVNEIITHCYSCLDKKYEYTLMIKLKDNIHIYLDLLDYYVKASKECLDKYLVSGEVKKRLTFIATKQYAGKSGGMYDVAFSFEWVRYQIARVLELEKSRNVGRPALKEAFQQHENQYERLRELEKIDPNDLEKYYRLDTWDTAVFEGAEEIVSGKSEPWNAGEESRRCALYMLIVMIHTKRNVEKDMETLVRLIKTVDASPFRKQLEELFVTDKYGVFHGGEYAESRELVRKSLGMAMHLKIATTESQLTNIHRLYEEAFPKSEKKPFDYILQKREQGSFEILEIVDESGDFCGLAIMMLYEDLVLLDYFAIAPQCRGTGLGSEALRALQERYAGKKFMLEVESTVGVDVLPKFEKHLRLRRKAFYLRNGMTPMDFQIDLFGVEMEILAYGESVTFEEYYSILKSTTPPNLIHHVKLL